MGSRVHFGVSDNAVFLIIRVYKVGGGCSARQMMRNVVVDPLVCSRVPAEACKIHAFKKHETNYVNH